LTKQRLDQDLDAHIALFQEMKADMADLVLETGRLMRRTLESGGKILVAGNGGSAADAQHFAAELVGRYLREREAMAAIALTTDTSILTAVANDYGYEQVFSRQIEGLARPGDLFAAISTSGNSQNLVRALEVARARGLATVALLGKGGGKMAALADHALVVPSDSTPLIQVAHHWIYHAWCDLIDRADEANP